MWYTKSEIERKIGRIIGQVTKVYESQSRRDEGIEARYLTAEDSDIGGADLEVVGYYSRRGRLTWI